MGLYWILTIIFGIAALVTLLVARVNISANARYPVQRKFWAKVGLLALGCLVLCPLWPVVFPAALIIALVATIRGFLNEIKEPEDG